MNLMEFVNIFKIQLALFFGIATVAYLSKSLQNKYLVDKAESLYKTYENDLKASGKSSKQPPTLFTKAFLAEFNGMDGKPIYLGLLGKVYDVSKGSKHYGPNSAYNYFAGRDASIAFITGEFGQYSDDEADDVLKLTNDNDLYSLDKWQQFYNNDYTFVGRVIGRFYDNKGNPTKYLELFQNRVQQIKVRKALDQEIRRKYPDCNVEWTPTSGTHVWCDKQSGGNTRDWVGVPRKLYEIGSNEFRCACINENDVQNTDIMIKLYENCDNQSHECFYEID